MSRMKIIKHKSLNIDTADAIKYFRKEKPLPKGVAMNITGDTIILEPEDLCNLFGTIDENYEIIYYAK